MSGSSTSETCHSAAVKPSDKKTDKGKKDADPWTALRSGKDGARKSIAKTKML